MQHRLLRPGAPGGEKACQFELIARPGALHQMGVRPEGHCLQFAFDLARQSGFDLFRGVGHPELQHRHAGRGVAQLRQLDDAPR
jgi:hypothetical protein